MLLQDDLPVSMRRWCNWSKAADEETLTDVEVLEAVPVQVKLDCSWIMVAKLMRRWIGIVPFSIAHGLGLANCIHVEELL